MELWKESREALQFKTPEEEISFLREQISKKERELQEKYKVTGEKPKENAPVRDLISEYKNVSYEEAIHKDMKIPDSKVDGIVLDLAPEAHDNTMGEILGIMQEKGVRAALEVISKMNDPHIEDDFERFLVQYLKSGFPLDGLRDKDPIVKALKMTLFEILLPEMREDDKQKPLKELISAMEQFYAGMLSVYDGTDTSADYFSIELAVANHSDEFVFYVAVPDRRKSLFEKHILSVFHGAKVLEKKDDYNIFSEGGATIGSYARFPKNNALPLKSYEEFDLDPLNVILNSFSKIDKDGEGAAIQILLKPSGDKYTKQFTKMVDKVHKGESLKEVMNPTPMFINAVEGTFKFLIGANSSKKDERKDQAKEMQKNDDLKALDKQTEETLEEIKKKASSPIFETNIRIVSSSRTEYEAEEILASLEASFNQFQNSRGNRLEWERIPARKSDKLAFEFAFRQFSEKELIPLNIKELTTMIHFPSAYIQSPELKMSRSASAPAPLEIAKEGIVLGVNRNRGEEAKIHFAREDRLRHFYAIGQTGTGKTTLLVNMITQDILNGDGVCMIDPHGSDIQEILSIIPKERYEDVIYFDPSYADRPMGLNMLEYDVNDPNQKTFVINELFGIFRKIYGNVPESMGPAFEQYFRNSAGLVMEHPESGNTLIDISRVLSDKEFRKLKLSHCKNPLITQFWTNAEKTTGDQGLANYVQYVTNKFDVFLANEIMRPVVGQEKSSFNFRDIMDNKKILLVNLSKGRLGDLNANLIGLILVGKILMSALSRVDSLGKDLPPFYLYIDEFQNVTTDSISTILSEARKYKLSLNIAHQFIAQLDEKIRDSVFGNVGSMAAFRVGAEDAEYLEKQYGPTFTAKDLMNVDNRNAYLKMLANGKPIKPFNIETLAPIKGDRDKIDKLKELSYLKFGRKRTLVEEEILTKYKKL